MKKVDCDDDMNSSSDDSEDEMEQDERLLKLQETGEFITSGHEFYLFKDSLRTFLRSAPPSGYHMIGADNGLLNLKYDISPTVELTTAISDIYKRYIEYIAGSKLSWWPLVDPEDELKADYVRIYSMKFVSARPSLYYESLVLKTDPRRIPGSSMTFRDY